MMTDPIADMLTRIRNASAIERPYVEMPATKVKVAIAKVLVEEGFVERYQTGKYVTDAQGQKHVEESERIGVPRPERQFWFNKQVSCVNGPYDPMHVPRVSEQLDYEAELGVVIASIALPPALTALRFSLPQATLIGALPGLLLLVLGFASRHTAWGSDANGGDTTNAGGLIIVGFACLVNGILIVLPIPFGNTAPAIAVLLIALGLTACDGLAVLAGLAVTAMAALVDGGLIFLGYQGVASLLGLMR